PPVHNDLALLVDAGEVEAVPTADISGQAARERGAVVVGREVVVAPAQVPGPPVVDGVAAGVEAGDVDGAPARLVAGEVAGKAAVAICAGEINGGPVCGLRRAGDDPDVVIGVGEGQVHEVVGSLVGGEVGGLAAEVGEGGEVLGGKGLGL